MIINNANNMDPLQQLKYVIHKAKIKLNRDDIFVRCKVYYYKIQQFIFRSVIMLAFCMSPLLYFRHFISVTLSALTFTVKMNLMFKVLEIIEIIYSSFQVGNKNCLR